MSQSDAMKYARKQVTDHGHATLEGVRGIRTDVPIRSSVRSPFPPFRIKSKQKVPRLNADMLDGHHASDFSQAAIDASQIASGILAQQRGGLGKMLDLTGLADQYHLYYDAGSNTFKVASLPAGGSHALLSATHTDTLADSVVAGDLIYGNSTPKWARLVKSTDGKVLGLSGGYPAWIDPPAGSPHNLLDGSINQDTLAGTVVAGDIIIGNATPKWSRLAKGTDSYPLTMNPSTHLPAWGGDMIFGGSRTSGFKRMNTVPSASDIGTDGLVLYDGTATQTDTIGDTSSNNDNPYSYFAAQSIVPSKSGTLTSLGINVSTVAGNLRLALYSTYSGGKLSGLLGQSADTLVVSGWNDLSIGSVSITAGATYYPALQVSSSSYKGYFLNSGTQYYYSLAYGTFPDPTGTLNTGTETRNMRIKYSAIDPRLYMNLNGTVKYFTPAG